MADMIVPLPSGGTGPLVAGKKEADDKKIVDTLQSYFNEAKEARRSGFNPRDDKWSQNLDLYWNRYDWSNKAKWQAQEVMPEVPAFVDRFAAALKEALISTPQGFYTVVDPADQDNDIAQSVKRMTDVWLTTAGRNQVGQLLPFSAVFEEQMKLGAIMATSSITTWKNDVGDGRVAVESLDPRMFWMDHTGRNLYRIRRTELDQHELSSLINIKDTTGDSIYDMSAIANMVQGMRMDTEQWERERTGAGTNLSSPRKVVTLDEYIATVVDTDGTILADRSLMVVGNEKHLLRGPEANPFWHGKDWITYTPLVNVPLSPYGRSYMEDFGSIASTFTELTNMILDAVHVSAMKVWAMVPGMLMNPGQVAEGVTPNKIFMLEDGYDAKKFAESLDMGTLPPEAVQVWTSIKQELREAASINEIGIGQFAPKGRTSATEVTETQQSSSALIRSVAQTVETRWLDPTLDLIWKTGLQHVSKTDRAVGQAAGDKMFQALIAKRKDLIKRPLTFQARGISMLIQRGQMLKSLLQLLSIIAQNDNLLQAFLAEIDMQKLIKKLFELSNIDLTTLQLSDREKMIRSVTNPMNAGAGMSQGQPQASPGQSQMGSLARTMGIQR